MNLVVLLGSAPRSGAVEAIRSAGMTIHAVGVPAGSKHAAVAEALPAARALAKADVPEFLRQAAADVVLSLAWPYLFGPEIVNGPWLLLNSHPTLLPRFRGPNPWYHIIAQGATESGVTIHKIDAGVDSGPVLCQETVPLSPFDTYRSLRAKLLEAEPKAIVRALRMVLQGDLRFVAQDESQASSYLNRRTPADSEIDPRRSLLELFDQIRACDPDGFPAFFQIHGQKVCIRLWRPQRPAGEHPESL